MFPAEVYMSRREDLIQRIESGLILLLGNEESPMNFRDNAYPFRQDSTFLYFFGLASPGFTGIIDCDSGESWLFSDDLTIDDYIWMGYQSSVAEMALACGVRKTGSSDDTALFLARAAAGSREIHFLPPYRDTNRLKLSQWLNISFSEVANRVSEKLIYAVADKRNHKEPREIEEINRAVNMSVDMHVAAMKCCRPGVSEAFVAAEAEHAIHLQGGRPSFHTIATIHGEILHNHFYDNTLKKGDLFLLDAGAETQLGYAGDLSSTVPVGGRFSPVQSEIYSLTLKSHELAVSLLKPGVTFLDIYYESARVIVEGLKGMGLMKGSTNDALEQGAHALFFPCGLGHLMGLDVHDMEDLGEEIVGYGGAKKSTQFGVKSLRLGRKLEPGFVLTIEPGIYFIPQLIDLWKGENRHREFIDYNTLEKFRSFGGIRNEENFLITPDGYQLLGKAKPKSIEEVETITAT
jgi:Xaa-Pro aminopeptidase